MNAKDLIYYSTLAPSGHNTQPWKFLVENNVIRIFPDFERRLPVVDPDDHALHMSLGCALENLMIAANAIGLNGIVDYFSEDEKNECLRVTLSQNGDSGDEDLFEAIPVRQSNRSMYDKKAITTDHIQKLIEANDSKSVQIKIFDTKEKYVEPIIGFVKEGTRIQFSDQQFINELLSWIRFTKKEVTTRKDGLTAKVMGFPYVPRWLGRLILKTLVKPDSEASKVEKQIRSSSHLMLFICKKDDKKNWVKTGRTFQRVALAATSMGIAHAHLNMPCEVESVRRKLTQQLGLERGEQPILLIRLGYGDELPRSPRRLVGDVLIKN